ncbi:MAG: gamma carbonic anhydrase family protein [Desulfobacteraceae bacterium IS3]|nr:MAG: gamma carbonic anhydrase family protein [Desulfobacteraceae bacterium IS3]
MAIYRYGNRIPKIGKDSYVCDSARVIGEVVVGDNCYVGHGAILRGDYGTIILGDGTAIEENAVLHIRPEGLLELKEKVTVGHGALIHGKLLKTCAVIGIGAVIGFDVVVGEWSIVAEGCVVPRDTEIPDGKIAAGVPCKIIGDVQEKHKIFWTYGKQLYIGLAKDYPQKFERIG